MGACQSRTSAVAGRKSYASKEVRSFQASNIFTEAIKDDVTPSPHQSHIGLDELVQTRKTQGHFVGNIVSIDTPADDRRRIEDVYNGVHSPNNVLGEGIAGKVYLVTHRVTEIEYACKILTLDRTTKSTDHSSHCRSLRNEIELMAQLDHPNIARLQEVYEDEHYIYLVQELGSGGELFDVLEDQPEYHFEERDAVRLVHQMLASLRYLHSKEIVHRDLKLENFLFSTKRHKQLKMIDFGLSKHFDRGEVQHDVVGTPYTVAPEVILGQYDEKCDLWAIGVLAFLVLSGEAPFGDAESPMAELKENILKGTYLWEPAEIWNTVSPEAKDFVQRLLVTDPKLRPSASEAQLHPWIRAYHSSTIEGAIVDPAIVKSFVSFKELSLTKRLMCEVISFTLLPSQISAIRIEFEKFDTHGLGEISLECWKRVLQSPQQNSGLSEPDIREMFYALKIGKSAQRVHWHEVVAACLQHCNVDDRNLRLAFDRLDQDHNGFITVENVIQLVARDANDDTDALMQAWEDSVKEFQCDQSRFSFEDFCRFARHTI